MAKKKNTSKKHKFKHVEAAEPLAAQAAVAQPAGVAQAQGDVRPVGRAGVPAATTVRDFSYVRGDVQRIGIMAASLVALELVLFYILVHTPAGAAIYQLVKI